MLERVEDIELKRLNIVSWIALTAVVLFLFWNRRVAVYEDITFNTIEFQEVSLLPGDRVTQNMSVPYRYLEKVGVALSYPEDISEEAKVLVEVIAEEETIMSQELRVNACANGSFLDFLVKLDQCEGREITISVTNVTPETVSGGEFALMSSDKDFLFPDGISNCRLNDLETADCIFCKASCIKGYSYYRAATEAFLVFLAGAVVIEQLARKYQGTR